MGKDYIKISLGVVGVGEINQRNDYVEFVLNPTPQIQIVDFFTM